jgi:hypothetical protein
VVLFINSEWLYIDVIPWIVFSLHKGPKAKSYHYSYFLFCICFNSWQHLRKSLLYAAHFETSDKKPRARNLIWFSRSVKLKPPRLVLFKKSWNFNTMELKRLTVSCSWFGMQELVRNTISNKFYSCQSADKQVDVTEYRLHADFVKFYGRFND